MTDDFPKVLTVQEVAAILRVDVKTVRNWLGSGTLQGVRVGGVWRVREDAISSLLKEAPRHEQDQERAE